MTRVLTIILRRAVPDVRVEPTSAVVRTFTGHYWIWVEPNHGYYWERFKRTYPHWKRVACEYKALESSLVPFGSCPVFRVRENLINWLADTLGLSQGERKFIQLSVEAQSCQRSL